MKLNKYLLMAAMGLGLVACTENDLVEGGDSNGAQNEGTTYVGLKINFNSSSTRADGDQPIDGDSDDTLYDDQGDGNESLVKDVRIVVTDAEGNSQYNAVVTPTSNNGNNIYIFQITPGIKKFYAVVNGNALGLSTELTSWTGSQLTLEKKASDLYEYNATSTDGEGFLMSSVAAVEQTIQDNISEDAVIAGTANNVTIAVDRVVAKVTMQLKDGLTFEDQTATLKTLTCQIGNADNLKYNKDGEEDAAKYTTTGTYLMAYDDNDVRKTPYYTYPAENTETFWTGFDQTKLLNPGTVIYESGAVTSTPIARFYCLENTHGSGYYLQGNTTFIRVQAEMIPNSAKTFTYSAGEDPAVTISDRADMPETPETFYVITAAPNQDYQGSYVFASDLANLYVNLVPGGSETEQGKKAAAVVDALAKSYNYNFTEPYTDGCGYYNIWVNDMKNENNQYLNIAPVFRNDWYNLTITSLTLPGSPKEGLDPEEPIHPNTNVGVTLTVRDWNMVNHNVDLQ